MKMQTQTSLPEESKIRQIEDQRNYEPKECIVWM